MKEFIVYANAHPGKINYGTPGVGTVGHLTQEYFAHQTGIRITHVPYKGGVNQYTVDLMAGYIDSAMQQIFVATPFIRQGKLRALGVSSRTRSPVLPEIAPIAEQGVPDFESSNASDASVWAIESHFVTRMMKRPSSSVTSMTGD